MNNVYKDRFDHLIFFLQNEVKDESYNQNVCRTKANSGDIIHHINKNLDKFIGYEYDTFSLGFANIPALADYLNLTMDESYYLTEVDERIANKKDWPTFNNMASDRLKAIARLKFIKERIIKTYNL